MGLSKFWHASKIDLFLTCLSCLRWRVRVLNPSLPLCRLGVEFTSLPIDPVIIFMPEISRTHMGGMMRPGLWPQCFTKSVNGLPYTSSTAELVLYGSAIVAFYEVNPAYRSDCTQVGWHFSGNRLHKNWLPRTPRRRRLGASARPRTTRTTLHCGQPSEGKAR